MDKDSARRPFHRKDITQGTTNVALILLQRLLSKFAEYGNRYSGEEEKVTEDEPVRAAETTSAKPSTLPKRKGAARIYL